MLLEAPYKITDIILRERLLPIEESLHRLMRDTGTMDMKKGRDHVSGSREGI